MASYPNAHAETAAKRSRLAWWHLSSLDAPCVAALWTAFLARVSGVALSPYVPITLGLAVWFLYMGDRLCDAARGQSTEERHNFHKQHWRSFLLAAFAVAPVTIMFVERLPTAIRSGWLLLALPLCVYVAAVHLLNLPVWKEPLVAIFFAAATGLPTWIGVKGNHYRDAWMIATFGCLCWLNCIAVARWENSLHTADPCTAWLGRHYSHAAMGLVCVAMPLLRSLHTAPVALATIASAVCLLVLDDSQYQLDRTTLRALADASLLTPLAAWSLVSSPLIR